MAGRWAARGTLIAFALGAAAPAAAQSVTTVGPVGSTITEGTPRFTITTAGFTAAQSPIQLRLQISVTSDFAGPFLADTTVTGTQATIVIPRLLPPGIQIWWRTIARTAQGALVTENATGPRTTSQWLTLVSPNNRNGATLTTPRPRFEWNAVQIHPPVAPWQFTIVIYRRVDAFPERTHGTDGTFFVPFSDLELNTPYEWAVSAVAGTGDSIRVASFSTFVIAGAGAPLATVMFQPFPNPFPTPLLDATCVWIDLKAQSNVTLDVLDLRGNHVRKLLPAPGLETLPSGRYGRASFGSDTGCDSRFAWDGKDDRGRDVRVGVYLIRFTGNGVSTVKRVLYKGR